MKVFSLRLPETIILLISVCLLLIAGTAAATERTWTDDLNRTWQGEFLRVDGTAAVFLVNGKEYPFPVARLSVADKLLVFKLRQIPPAAGPTAASPTPAAPLGNAAPVVPSTGASPAPVGAGQTWTFGSVQLEPGKTVETDLPLPTEFVSAVARSYGDVAPAPTHIRASLAVPSGFNASKPQKVLVVSATASGETLSIPIAKSAYAKDALAHDYLVLAADGGYGKP